MKDSFSVGEIVQSLAGHDKQNLFVVLSVCDEYVFMADGKTRKVSKPKRKKIKHIKKVSAVSEELAEHIKSGKPIANQKILTAIKTAKQNKQED